MFDCPRRIPEDAFLLLQEIEELSALVDQLSIRATEILGRAVDGENVVQLRPAGSSELMGAGSGWGKRRELGK